jgi:hypothetical protein
VKLSQLLLPKLGEVVSPVMQQVPEEQALQAGPPGTAGHSSAVRYWNVAPSLNTLLPAQGWGEHACGSWKQAMHAWPEWLGQHGNMRKC